MIVFDIFGDLVDEIDFLLWVRNKNINLYKEILNGVYDDRVIGMMDEYIDEKYN